eukprot:6176288-Amphidinium_carterae.1
MLLLSGVWKELVNSASEKAEQFQRMLRAGSQDDDAKFYEVSLKEAAKGWLVDPASKDDVDAMSAMG